MAGLHFNERLGAAPLAAFLLELLPLVNDDLAVTKSVVIRENVRFSLQGEFLNAFNHPNFGTPDSGVQDPGFGTDYGPANSARAIELRANLSF